MHLYSDYQITNKPLSDLTLTQYNAILEIINQIVKFKQKHKPIVSI